MPTNDISEHYLHELKKLILHYFEGKNVNVYLYGSRAKGTERKRSDVDIAIQPLQKLPVGCLGSLAEKIEQSHIPYSVDLVNLNDTSDVFKEQVLKEGILWKD